MDKKAIAQEWFEVANQDLASANYLQNMQPVPIEIICYHCQQTAEKYLKGFLAYLGKEVRKTHDLVLLNKLCQEVDNEFKKIAEDCLLLTDYGVNIRYPYPLELNEEDMQLALKNAANIKNFVESKITN
ncbi:MAG: DNA-binding protein [Chloroflexi bacterium]|nr:MAG: DNA-binding protein [Chloroflexota bacterium]